MTDRTLFVAASSLDHRQRKNMSRMLRGNGNGRFMLTDEVNADVSMLDMDVPGAEKIWEKFRKQYPQRSAILLSSYPVQKENALFVKKPININDLLTVLEQKRAELGKGGQAPSISIDKRQKYEASNQIAGGVQQQTKSTLKNRPKNDDKYIQQYCGMRGDVNPHNPKEYHQIFYDPNKYLLSVVLKGGELARTKEVAVRIDIDSKPIIISPGATVILYTISEHMLRSLCLVPVETTTITLKELQIEEYIKLKKRAYQERKLYSYDAFCWNMVLWSSRGRLPEETDPNAPVYIRYWPNLTRMTLTPHAMRIVALWRKQPRSLFNTAEELKIPQRYVFALYTAAHALNLAGMSRRAVDFTFVPERIQASRYRTLYLRLLNRLRAKQ